MEELEEFLTTEPREKVHMVEEHNAHAYRLAQTQEFLDLFQAAHRGRPARTVEELEPGRLKASRWPQKGFNKI